MLFGGGCTPRYSYSKCIECEGTGKVLQETPDPEGTGRKVDLDDPRGFSDEPWLSSNNKYYWESAPTCPTCEGETFYFKNIRNGKIITRREMEL
jgi:hypothetical protein